MRKFVAKIMTVGLVACMLMCGCSSKDTTDKSDTKSSNLTDSNEEDDSASLEGLSFKKVSEYADKSGYPAITENLKDVDAYACIIDKDAPESIVIPDEYDGLPVKAVLGSDNNTVKELTISEGIIAIQDLFPYSNDSLVSVSFPDSIKAINNSFSECNALADISFGALDNVTIIKSFKKTPSITNLEFRGAVNLKNYMLEDETFVNTYLFTNAATLKDVTFNDKVILLPESFCSSCDSLEKVTFKGDVTQISYMCFNGCKNLTDIVFEGKVGTIGPHCFTDAAITQLTFANDVDTISEYSFQSCEDLTQLTFKGNINELNTCFALCNKLKSIQFEKNIDIIDNAFSKCAVLKSVDFDADINTISEAFTDCPELEDINFNADIKNISKMAFYNSEKVVLNNLSADVVFDSEELSHRFDSAQQIYRAYYDKLNSYSDKDLKEWFEKNVAGKTLDAGKKIDEKNATQYADIINGPIIYQYHCTDCPYEKYNREAALDNEYFVETVKEIKKTYPDTIYTDEKALKVAKGSAPLVIGVADSLGYVPVDYVDKDNPDTTETLYFEMMRVSIWNIETGELLAWYDHCDGTAPTEYNSHDKSDYVYLDRIGTDHDYYFFEGGYTYPMNFLMETIYPE